MVKGAPTSILGLFQVTLEEVNSQIALEYGQAMTVRVCKMDGEVMRKYCLPPQAKQSEPSQERMLAGLVGGNSGLCPGLLGTPTPAQT